MVLVGSPGTDLAHSAADFHLSPGGHLYVGAASGDVVTWSPGHVTGPGLVGPTLGGLGDDPSVDAFGATRFRAENPHYTGNPIYDHSHYFDKGSESLFSVSDVVFGGALGCRYAFLPRIRLSAIDSGGIGSLVKWSRRLSLK